MMYELLRKSLEIYPTSSFPPTEATPSFFSGPLIWMQAVEGPLCYSSCLEGSVSELRRDRKGLKLSASSRAAFRK